MTNSPPNSEQQRQLTRLHTEGGTDTEDGAEQHEGDETGRRGTTIVVRHRAHNDEQNGSSEKFVEEAPDIRHVWQLTHQVSTLPYIR